MSLAEWRQTVLAALSWLLLAGAAAAQMAAPALRSAMPLLCTENSLAPRTRVRGTGVIADSGGTLLTAAHIVLEARSNCTLSVMIPDDEWSRVRSLRAFLLETAICTSRWTWPFAASVPGKTRAIGVHSRGAEAAA